MKENEVIEVEGETYRRRQDNIIQSPAEHRAFLLEVMVKVAEGKTSVGAANAIAGLSEEVHKSIRLQWDMHVFAAANIRLLPGGEVLAVERIDPDGE